MNPPNPEPPDRSGTLLETDDDIRQALGPTRAAGPMPVEASVGGMSPLVGRPASPYRPTTRPAVAMLVICDDGKADGEVIRLRGDRFVVGRSEGGLKLPHDGRVSAKHVEITRQVVGGLNRWVVTDLQSTNGLFVRVSRTVLADKAEFLVGGGRYRFDLPPGDAVGSMTADQIGPAGQPAHTHGWAEGPGPFRPPALTELIGHEIGNRVLLVKPEYWIGNDPSCAICRAEDPFCEPRHVRLSRGHRGAWQAEHHKTHNGLWLRMTQVTVESQVQFQVGEQRFRLKV